MLPASQGLNYLSRMASGSTGTPACALFATVDSACMHEGGENRTAKSGCATKARENGKIAHVIATRAKNLKQLKLQTQKRNRRKCEGLLR
jgi:hypothetical protein